MVREEIMGRVKMKGSKAAVMDVIVVKMLKVEEFL